MKCYAHDNTDAVAVCSHCGKAICKECVQTSSLQQAVCSDECKSETKKGDLLQKMMTEYITATGRTYKAMSIAFWILGIPLILFGFGFLAIARLHPSEVLLIAGLIGAMGIGAIYCARSTGKTAARFLEISSRD